MDAYEPRLSNGVKGPGGDQIESRPFLMQILIAIDFCGSLVKSLTDFKIKKTYNQLLPVVILKRVSASA